jgi:hypothetical protein
VGRRRRGVLTGEVVMCMVSCSAVRPWKVVRRSRMLMRAAQAGMDDFVVHLAGMAGRVLDFGEGQAGMAFDHASRRPQVQDVHRPVVEVYLRGGRSALVRLVQLGCMP